MTRLGMMLVAVAWGGFTIAAEPRATFPNGKFGKGELKHVHGMPVVVVRGTPVEIGEQLGVLTVKAAPGLDEMHANFLRDAKIEDRSTFLNLMARRLAPNFPPDHRTEIEAMAKAGGRQLDLALFANTVYDLSSGMGCSTVVVEKGRSKTGAPIFGRNFDWRPSKGLTEHTLLAVFHPEGKRAFATVTICPIVGCISGMNDAGLACTINEIRLRQSKDKAAFNWDGTPTLLAFRRVLEECATVAEAETLLSGMKRTTSACLTICDRDGGAVIEVTPKTVVRRSAVHDVCLCTNHLRCDGLSKGEKCWRYTALEPLQHEDTKLGVADVFAQLHEVNQGKQTLQSMVFEPAKRTLHLKYGPGPATKLEAKTYELGEWFDK
ncbi:MAG TPA: C45 family peptidase [Fimbriiglobus sp.]|nr:C45 family peptidase [Fimbriiglobus sp.]